MRGGVPLGLADVPRDIAFSPHAWGCSEGTTPAHSGSSVFPTCVGVFRPIGTHTQMNGRFPHMRGGVPNLLSRNPSAGTFSPHAWGCSGYRAFAFAISTVFPTCVGVFRAKGDCDDLACRFPHMRGGVPAGVGSRAILPPFSPHAWGCSVETIIYPEGEGVFPTCVGVFRLNRTHPH